MQPVQPGMPVPDHQRIAILNDVIADQLRQGWRVESRPTPYAVVLAQGQPVNHILHAIITIFTCFVWGIVWIALAVAGGVKRQTLAVDPYGQITH